MNLPLQRVFDGYAVALLLAVAVPPWRGTSLAGEVPGQALIYAWIWAPPRMAGWVYVPDFPRLLLEVLSLTLVLAAAFFSLRD